MNNIAYNPEGSLLRNDQIRLLNMLKVVADICKKHNVPWWLSSGTLLGAARHKGFIPWDDDMDIVMLRKDYQRLEKILIKSLEGTPYVLHCMKTDVDYVNTFGKFRLREGRITGRSGRYNYYKWKGIGLDIFSIEKTNRISAFVADKIYHRLQANTINIQRGGKKTFNSDNRVFLFLSA